MDLIQEKEFAIMIRIPLSRLIRWRKFYGAPYHRINRRVYYELDEFFEWFDSEPVF